MKQASRLLEKDDFFTIAKLVDNEFIGSEKTFSADRKAGYNYLTTNKVDHASCVRVWNDLHKVTSIEVLGDYTNGWQLVTKETMKKVTEFLKFKTP